MALDAFADPAPSRARPAVVDIPWARDSGEPTPRYTFVYPEDIKLTPREWLIPSIIPAHGFGVMFGPSGCGKSFLLVAIGFAVAGGSTFVGRPCKQGGVIYVAAEDVEGIKFRAAAYLKAHDADGDVPFAIIPEAPDIFGSSDDVDKLIDAINAETAVLRERGAPPALIMIDTMRDVTPGMDENDSREMAKATKALRRIAHETGTFVLAAHHVPKGGDGEDPRGSTALIGSADMAIGLRADASDGSPVRSMWIRKQRNGPDTRGDKSLSWSYSLRSVALDVMGQDNEPERSCVVDIEEASPLAARERRAPPSAVMVRKAVVALLSADAGQAPPAGLGCPTGHKAVKVAAARDKARSLGISDGATRDPADATRKAFARGKEWLIANNQLFEAEGWLWLPK